MVPSLPALTRPPASVSLRDQLDSLRGTLSTVIGQEDSREQSAIDPTWYSVLGAAAVLIMGLIVWFFVPEPPRQAA